MGLVLCALLLLGPQVPAGSRAGADALLEAVKELAAREQWQAILDLVPDSPDNPPELDYRRGMALAALQRWPEARAALERGRAKAPQDKRFPIELAGIAFKSGMNSEARRLLRRALKLDALDSYANDFLASLFFLEGNQEAAIKYWNRAGKPMLEEIRILPRPRVDPVLLDRCFTFAPASLLRLGDYRATHARLAALEIFAQQRSELVARQDGKFDFVLRPVERSGLGAGTVKGLITLLRGLPFESVLPEAYNLRGTAYNVRSLVRWDDRRRRAYASVSGPIAGNPAWRMRFEIDGRDEQWEISRALRQPQDAPVAFRMKTVRAALGVGSSIGGRWKWQTAVEADSRHYEGQPTDAPALFAEGPGVGQTLRLENRTLILPERRFALTTFGTARWGRILAAGGSRYASAGGGLEFNWFPQSRGSAVEIAGRFSAARSSGGLPFDRLYSLGRERDNDLALRGHGGTRDGRKGAGPLGPDYVLLNLEVNREIYRRSRWKLVLAPLVDVGRTFDARGLLGSGAWQWDTGVQLKAVLFERVGLVLCYGKSLRTGENTFFGTTY